MKETYHEAMKPRPEMIEGPEAFTRFRSTMAKLLRVSKKTLAERVEFHRANSAGDENRRGPKRKAKPADPA